MCVCVCVLKGVHELGLNKIEKKPIEMFSQLFIRHGKIMHRHVTFPSIKLWPSELLQHVKY
jgi:hypothetical protein